MATGISATTYTDTGLMARATYYYQVESVNTAGTSAPSNVAKAVASASNVVFSGTIDTNRIAGVWYSSSEFTITLDFKDAAAHPVEFYLLDWGG